MFVCRRVSVVGPEARVEEAGAIAGGRLKEAGLPSTGVSERLDINTRIYSWCQEVVTEKSQENSQPTRGCDQTAKKIHNL